MLQWLLGFRLIRNYPQNIKFPGSVGEGQGKYISDQRTLFTGNARKNKPFLGGQDRTKVV